LKVSLRDEELRVVGTVQLMKDLDRPSHVEDSAPQIAAIVHDVGEVEVARRCQTVRRRHGEREPKRLLGLTLRTDKITLGSEGLSEVEAANR
jgi:hypothetical protein